MNGDIHRWSGTLNFNRVQTAAEQQGCIISGGRVRYVGVINSSGFVFLRGDIGGNHPLKI